MVPVGPTNRDQWPAATCPPHAPPRPGHWSRFVASTGTVESLVPVDATNRDQWAFLYTRAPSSSSPNFSKSPHPKRARGFSLRRRQAAQIPAQLLPVHRRPSPAQLLPVHPATKSRRDLLPVSAPTHPPGPTPTPAVRHGAHRRRPQQLHPAPPEP